MGAITVARGASGSVCREYRDAGLHKLGRLGGHCSTVRLEMCAITVARGCLGMRAITIERVPREACDGNPGMPGCTSWRC